MLSNSLDNDDNELLSENTEVQIKKRTVKRLKKSNNEQQEDLSEEQPKKRTVKRVKKKEQEQVMEESNTDEKEPEQVMEESNTDEKEPEQVMEESNTDEKEPEQVMEESNTDEKESEQVMEESNTDEKEPEQVMEESNTDEKEPEQVMEELKQVIEESNTVEKESEQVMKQEKKKRVYKKKDTLKVEEPKEQKKLKESKSVKKNLKESKQVVEKKVVEQKKKRVYKKKDTLESKEPEQVKEESKEPEQVKEESKEPEQVKEESKEPEQVKEESKDPEQVKEELKEPEQVKEELKEPEQVKEVIKKNVIFEIKKEQNNYIENLLNENTKEDLFDNNSKDKKINEEELESKINNIVSNLKKNIVNEYNINEVKDTFALMSESAILVQIINNKLFYLEKKSDENKNSNIINQLHNLTNKYLINDTTFIIDTSNKINIDKNYILRFNKYEESKNLLLINYNTDDDFKMKSIKWEDKKDKIYINEKYLSKELYGKLKYSLNKEDFDFNNNSDYEEVNEYKYILYEDTLETINYEIHLLRLNTIIVKIDSDNEKIETFYSKYFKENEHYLSFKIDNFDNLDKLIEYKTNINHLDSIEMVNNLSNSSKELFNSEIIDRYTKNILSRLSVKCATKQIISNRIFVTNKENNYLYNRLNHNDNIFEFHFQGKDFEIKLKDNNKKINILLNETVTNIYYNNNNIFNFKISGLVSDRVSSKYTFVIRNKILYLYKNNKMMIKETLPVVFNIETLSIRTFNKDSWWVC